MASGSADSVGVGVGVGVTSDRGRSGSFGTGLSVGVSGFGCVGFAGSWHPHNKPIAHRTALVLSQTYELSASVAFCGYPSEFAVVFNWMRMQIISTTIKGNL